MGAVTTPDYLSLGLTEREYTEIVRLLGRDPSPTELGMFSVQWSEHCSYKCSRPVLAYFKKYKEAIEGAGLENAGVVPIGDGLGVVLKIESHNHPSAVEPYQGAATGVGGIVRDIFTMGARPVALLNSLRFGPIQDGKAAPDVVTRNRYLFEHVVAGIAGYGNCVGIPTVAGEVAFHPRYSGNPLVNAMCVGIVELGKVTTAGAAGPGNPVIYLGSATGKDGIHGASFASEVLGEDSEDKRPNVQIGDPFAEKLLIEATLEALETGAVQSIQDMGAAGLTCSTTEMSAKGGVGMEIDLDLVPMRERDMTAYELMLSESQERMLCVADAGREQEVIAVFHKWGLNAVVVGKVTSDGNIKVWRHGELTVDAPAKAFTDGCPVVHLESREPASYQASADFDLSAVPDLDPAIALERLLTSPTLASKRWVYQQYDQQVMTQTTLVSGVGDSAVLAPRGTRRGLSMKVDGNSRWVAQDPYVGGLLAVCEAARNVACTGAMPVAATDGLNYGNPMAPHVFWQFERSVRGLADACEALEIPIVSGNVSFYNESDLGEVPPTPLVGVVGVLEDATDRLGSAPNPGDHLVALWTDGLNDRHGGLGASSYLAEAHGLEAGRPMAPNLVGERSLHRVLTKLARLRLVNAAHDVSEGGLVFALAEVAILGNTGLWADFDLSPTTHVRNDATLFGERPGLVVLSTADPKLLTPHLEPGLHMAVIGAVTDTGKLDVRRQGETLLSIDVGQLSSLYESTLPRHIGH